MKTYDVEWTLDTWRPLKLTYLLTYLLTYQGIALQGLHYQVNFAMNSVNVYELNCELLLLNTLHC